MNFSILINVDFKISRSSFLLGNSIYTRHAESPSKSLTKNIETALSIHKEVGGAKNYSVWHRAFSFILVLSYRIEDQVFRSHTEKFSQEFNKRTRRRFF